MSKVVVGWSILGNIIDPRLCPTDPARPNTDQGAETGNRRISC